MPDRTIEEAARKYEEQFGVQADAVAITLAVRRINALMVTSIGRFLDSLGLDVSLSGARLTVLRAIYFGQDHRLGLNELWQQLQVSRTNVTNLIDSLERDGLVERAINPADRRVVDARLTLKGRELCEAVLPQIGAYMEGLCRNFSRADLQRFGKYLARFQEELLLRASAANQED